MQTKEAYHKLALLCSRKEYCSSDLIQKMKKWDISSSQQEKIISDLKQEKYIDETRYAAAFVKDKFRFNKWGKQKIKYQLQQKNISEFDIDDAMLQITDIDYIEMVKHLLILKNKNVKGKSNYERKGKLLRFMIQKGFGIDIVNKVVDQIIED